MNTYTQKGKQEHLKSKETELYNLVLHNDEENDFDEVVEALVDICEHEFEQAYQCTFIAHHKGKSEVKTGKLDFLQKLKTQLNQRQLEATIE